MSTQILLFFFVLKAIIEGLAIFKAFNESAKASSFRYYEFFGQTKAIQVHSIPLKRLNKANKLVQLIPRTLLCWLIDQTNPTHELVPSFPISIFLISDYGLRTLPQNISIIKPFEWINKLFNLHSHAHNALKKL